MTLQQCRYIVEIAAHHSIRRAAGALYVTQPAVSKAVRELEQELGIVIFERTNQGVDFTPDGQELLFMAKLLIEQAGAIAYHFDRSAPVRTSELSVSSQHYCCMGGALMEFTRHWPRYTVSFREGKADDVVDDVAQSRSIVGFLSLNPRSAPYFERIFHERELDFRELAITTEHVFIRRGHPLATLPVIPLEKLADYPCLTYRQDDLPLHLSESPAYAGDADRIIYLSDRGTMRDLLTHTDGYNVGTGILDPEDPLLTALPLAEGQWVRVGCIKRRQTFLPDVLEDYVRLTGAALAAACRT